MAGIINREARKITVGQPHNASGLPRISIVLSREDGQHTSLTAYPTHDDVAGLTDQEFFERYVREMLQFARDRYNGIIT